MRRTQPEGVIGATDTISDEELRSGVRELCARYTDEYWRRVDREEAYPQEFVDALTEAGWLAALIPAEYGGAGLGISQAAVIMEEINRSGANGGACHAQMYIMGTVLRHGSDEQKQEWLPRIASGELRLQAFGVTEPDAGLDTLSIRTRARRVNDSYVVSGQKIWTSRALQSDLMLLLARTNEPDDEHPRWWGLSTFLVDLRAAGEEQIRIQPIETMLNHNTTEVFIDDLEVPARNRIGEEGMGFRYILDGMNAERILIAAECVGDGRWFVERAVKHARERAVFGRPIGQNQGVAFPIAWAHARIEAADLMRRRAADVYERGESCAAEANMAKLLAADASWQAANMCLDTHGGFGFAREFDVERKFRETRLYQVAPVTTNMILSYLAQNVLGLPRSY
ncbi:MAG TPA: acyl-CoA dehydrogenase family protein [Solirubrobacteraceae bacterium]|nr:acyl-CoA dehydrogenase family protein [Solirubrobacteraceae bacterium]